MKERTIRIVGNLGCTLFVVLCLVVLAYLYHQDAKRKTVLGPYQKAYYELLVKHEKYVWVDGLLAPVPPEPRH